MSGNTNKGSGFFLNFLAGSAIGGILGFLFAPESGRQLRQDLQEDLNLYLEKVKITGNKIVEEGKKIADELIERSNQLVALVNKYVDGNFKESIDRIEKEIGDVKNSINSAIETYRANNTGSENSPEEIADDVFIDFVKENSEEYDQDFLPLQEGMKRRYDRKY